MCSFDGRIGVVLMANGYLTPDGVGDRVVDLNDLVALGFLPGAVDEVGRDVPVGEPKSVAGEFSCGLGGHRSTAVFTRSRERFWSA